MNRRSFVAALAGMPFVGKMFPQDKDNVVYLPEPSIANPQVDVTSMAQPSTDRYLVPWFVVFDEDTKTITFTANVSKK